MFAEVSFERVFGLTDVYEITHLGSCCTGNVLGGTITPILQLYNMAGLLLVMVELLYIRWQVFLLHGTVPWVSWGGVLAMSDRTIASRTVFVLRKATSGTSKRMVVSLVSFCRM